MVRRPRLVFCAWAAMGLALLVACGRDEQPAKRPAPTLAVSFAVWYAAGAPDDFQALEAMLTEGGEGTVRRHQTWSEWVRSKADVLVLRGFHGSQPALDLKPLQGRRVIGIGDEASATFQAMGLDLTDGATSHADVPSVVLGGGPTVLDELRGRRLVALREPVPLDVPEPIQCDGVFLPADEALATQVEALARWSHDPKYAPITRQGNVVFCAIKPDLKVWTPAFRSAFRDIAAALGRAPLQPFKLGEWDITPPGTYALRLGVDGTEGAPTGKTFFFKFAAPVVFSAELEMRRGGQVRLRFHGQSTDRASEQLDTRHGEPLTFFTPVTEPSVVANGERYWELEIRNFDRSTPVDATLRIAYDSRAVLRFSDGLEVPLRTPPRAPSTIEQLVKHLASGNAATAAKAAAALQLVGKAAEAALDAAWLDGSEELRDRIVSANVRIDREYQR